MSHLKQFLTIILTVLLLSLFQGQSQAEDAYDIHGDLIAWTSLPADGKIDQVTMNAEGLIKTIIIGDVTYTFAADAIFRDAKGGLASQTSFKEGQYVEFYYLETTTIITKIWISTEELALEHSRQRSSLVSEETDTGSEEEQPHASPPPHPGEVILKDGVYQN